MSDKEGKKKERHSHAPRNYLLPGGIWRYGRYSMSQKRRAYAKKKPAIPVKSTKRTHYKIKPVGGKDNGGTRLVQIRKSVSSSSIVFTYVYGYIMNTNRGNGIQLKMCAESCVTVTLRNLAGLEIV